MELVDADLSTISLQADRVLKVQSRESYLSHFELVTGHHGEQTPHALLQYNVLLSGKHRLTVRSAVVLLRREADSPALTGLLEYRHIGDVYLSFSYQVVRVWQLPLEELLAGGLGTLPLAPLVQSAETHMPEVVRRMKRRLESEASPEEAREIWAATNILMGLRYTQSISEELLKGVGKMRGSVTYRAILEEGEATGRAEGRVEGRVDGEREMFLRLATRRLGAPSPDVSRRIAAITSADQLLALGERLLESESWEELMRA